MSIEKLRMENKTDSNSGLSKKHTPRYVAARITAIGSMILSSCGIKIPSGNQEIDSNESIPPKVNVEDIPVSNIETSIPAPLPSTMGETVEIQGSNYPNGIEGFILDDTRSNEKKIEIIKFLAPDDYQKEIDLYRAEIKRMGLNEKDFNYIASIADGKSWIIIPKNVKTGEIFVPSINNIIQASLHLFGYLDRAPGDDFFDLIPVKISNATVLADKSGWHVVAEKNGDSVSKWYDVKNNKITTIEIEPTPTPEAYLGIEIETDPTTPFEQLPIVTYEDFETQKILKAEKKYLETHNPFTGNEIWPEEFFSTITAFGYGRKIQIRNTNDVLTKYFEDNGLLPTRTLFFYRIDIPENFFSVFPPKQDWILIGQLWLNPKSESSLPEDKYRIIHHLYEKSSPEIPEIKTKKFVPLPLVSFDAEKALSEKINGTMLPIDIWVTLALSEKFYHDDIPYKYVQEWKNTGIIPSEMEEYIFPGWGHNFHD